MLMLNVCIVSGSAELNIAVEVNTTVRINTSAPTNTKCEVCIIRQDARPLCQSSVVLRSDTLLDFSCSQPENVFTVQIIRDNGESCLMKKILFILYIFIYTLCICLSVHCIYNCNCTQRV